MFTQSAFAVGEKTVFLGGSSSWNAAENRTGIIEAASVRPYSVLLLSSLAKHTRLEPEFDLSVSFDERDAGLFRDNTGQYKVSVQGNAEVVGRNYARIGQGAALFSSSRGSVVIEPQRRSALFASGNRIGDFSIEFWLCPLNLENGEGILTWYSSGINQIQCIASKNRLQWKFVNFFASSNNEKYINIEFSGNTPIVPKTWSHHLVRFDADTGMIEYLVDGVSEAIVYATGTGRESRDVYTPVAGNNGFFRLG